MEKNKKPEILSTCLREAASAKADEIQKMSNSKLEILNSKQT